jgi:hypothetical protein
VIPRVVVIVQSWVIIFSWLLQQLRHRDSSGTQKKVKVRRWKSLPEDSWRPWLRTLVWECVCVTVICKVQSQVVSKSPRNPDTNPIQSSWLQIQGSWFDSRLYRIFWEVVGLERGPLSLVSTTEELLGSKNSGCGLENREYGRRVPSRWPRGTLYPQKVALTSPTSGGR